MKNPELFDVMAYSKAKDQHKKNQVKFIEEMAITRRMETITASRIIDSFWQYFGGQTNGIDHPIIFKTEHDYIFLTSPYSDNLQGAAKHLKPTLPLYPSINAYSYYLRITEECYKQFVKDVSGYGFAGHRLVQKLADMYPRND